MNQNTSFAAICITKSLLIIAILLGFAFQSIDAAAAPPGDAQVSPGRFDLRLGTEWPIQGSVKLQYPKSAVLQNTLGDLLFNITLFKKGDYSSIDVYIPPEFLELRIDHLWTSITNNYTAGSLSLSQLSSNDRIGPAWWRVSIFRIRVADSTDPARRQFKADETQYLRLFDVRSPTILGRYFFKVFMNGISIGSANYPTLVVKADHSPAYVSGILREGMITSPFYSQPISLPSGYGGKVVAQGRSVFGKDITGQAFINSTASGYYVIYGLAAGTYNITAYAAGYVPVTLNRTISLQPFQSLESVDIYLTQRINVTGLVISKDYTGSEIPWGTVVDFTGHPVNRTIIVELSDLNGRFFASTPAPFRPLKFTNEKATRFDFVISREVGFDGHIPQEFANYTSGIQPGDYYVRAYVPGYVQLVFPIVHMGEASSAVKILFDIRRGTTVRIIIHFKDLPGLLNTNRTALNGTLSAQMSDIDGVLRASNQTFVRNGTRTANITLIGLSTSRILGDPAILPRAYGILPGTYRFTLRFTSSGLITGFSNVGVRDLYFQLDELRATVGSGPGPAEISLDMVKAGTLDVTITSVDWQIPPVPRPWRYHGSSIELNIIDSFGNILIVNSTQPAGDATKKFMIIGFKTDAYTIRVFSPGYLQRNVPLLTIQLGMVSDIRIEMIVGPVIDLTLVFRREGLFDPIDNRLRYAHPINNVNGTPARFEIYDIAGNLVGANITYIPPGTNNFEVHLIGFKNYYGIPFLTFANFYDTTDAVKQKDAGLPPGTYTLRVWVEGYYERLRIQLILRNGSESSAVLSYERLTLVAGTTLGFDIYDELFPLSWVVITPLPGDAYTYSLDGSFEIWLPKGEYKLGLALAGFAPQILGLSVSWGALLNYHFNLEQTGSRVPEFSASAILLIFAVFAADLAKARRKPRAGLTV